MGIFRFVLVACLLATTTACDREPAQAPAVQSAVQDAAPPQVPADPNAINDALDGNSFRATISIAKAPYASTTDAGGMEIVVKVTNEGTAALYGVGTKPVNLGIQILGENDSTGGTGGVRDFTRTPLPYVPAGSQTDVIVAIPADQRLQGRKLRIALVQEFVSWHDETADSRIDLGPFTICDNQVCDASGAALPN